MWLQHRFDSPLWLAPKGERATGAVPRNRGTNTTLIASLSWQGRGECMIMEGATAAAVFEQYIEHILAPALPSRTDRDYGSLELS
jgi:hypothetical protein